jgi:hypothetical protein
MRKLAITLLLVTASCASPSSQRPWTGGEQVAAILFTGAAVWNLCETERLLDNPNSVELNPIYGERPSDARLIGSFAVSHALALTIGHYIPTITMPLFGQCELRKSIVYGKGLLNTGLAIHDRVERKR